MTPRHSMRLARAALLSVVLLSAVLLPGADAPADTPRENVAHQIASTRDTLRRLYEGILGRSGDGYVQHMGEPPRSLADLAAASAGPALTTATSGAVAMGHAGPYVARAGDADSVFVDAWGSPIALSTAGGALQLVSAGPDRDPATADDNLYYPLVPRPYRGSIAVRVISLRTSDGAGTPLDDAGAAVTIHYSHHGRESSEAARYDAGSGRFELDRVHVGRHYVSAAARVPPATTAAEGSAVVTLVGPRAEVTIQLVASATSTLCHTATSETLSVSADELAAHIDHGDAVGPCTTGETTVCHAASRKTLTLSSGAIAAHIRHGDTVGACEIARVCHGDRTREILQSELDGHLAHGDTEGSCSGTSSDADGDRDRDRDGSDRDGGEPDDEPDRGRGRGRGRD